MNHTSAQIEQRRSAMRQAIKAGDMEQAGFYARIIVGMQDFPVKLRPVKAILAEQAVQDARRKGKASGKKANA